MGTSRIPELHTSLLETGHDGVDGDTDYTGSPVRHSKSSGGWRSASFILAGGILERFAFYGLDSNLINFLTGPLEESVATAAANLNTWSGVVSLAQVLGAFFADSFIGRHRSIIVFWVIYIMGFVLLTLSATTTAARSVSTWNPGANEEESDNLTRVRILFYASLYVVAIGQAYKACLQAFGADQFEGKSEGQSKAKSSFFNWWLCGISIGSASAHLILHYIQDNISWGISFGIQCLAMIVGLILFLLGNPTYRFPTRGRDEASSSERINQQLSTDNHSSQNVGMITHQDSHDTDLRFLVNNALSKVDDDDSTDKNATSRKTKEPSQVLKLLPIWLACLPCAIAFAQVSTLFTKQATTLDRSIGSALNVPAATLKAFFSISVVLCIPMYDQIFVPVARMVTRYPSGITTLQRMGTGMAISIANMAMAALIEKKRLETARNYGLVDNPSATVPMSFWWLVPQYILFGLADLFIQVGMQEFFYDQVPKEMTSLGISFYYGTLGVGNFLSSFLVSMIDLASTQNGGESWFSDNLNRAHIDYFYWLLAGIGSMGLVAFVYFSKSYLFEK